MPANHQRPAAQTPASPRNTSKYTNKDGSKFITVPKGASESSQPSTPTSAKQVDPLPELPVHEATAAPTVNRKKQKRRQKAAAKAAAEQAASVDANGHHQPSSPRAQRFSKDEVTKDDQVYTDDEEGFEYVLDEELVNGSSGPRGRKSKKKKKKGVADIAHPAHHSPVHRASSHLHSHSPLGSHRGTGMSRDKIWSTSNQEERERIKEFWLGLGEDERKSLVKVEKDAVLRKMKEQQKHTCSCTVCGRKRTAIEEELEGLYDAYYVELEQFANQGGGPLLSATREYPLRGIQPSYPRKPPSRGRILEHVADDEDDDVEEIEDDFSQDDVDDDDAYTDDEAPDDFHPHERDMADFLTFGNSLQVKGGILTVADDLLKNDGKRFIEMMEQLAERRMAREEDARGHFSRGYGHPNGSYSTPHNNPPPDDEEFDDEEDEEDYDSQEEDYDEEEEEAMTEEQRMEEGRRMFQIFAARMFEQRVLSAYKEKVAKERQAQLIEELEEEGRKEDEQKAKKAKNAQKKKEKAAQKKLAAAEDKARREAEKAAEEAERLQTEQRRAEEQRRKAEEKKKQKEAQKKAEEDARLKKEAEKLRRQNDQRERQAEQERKARESKEREKKLKEEQKLKEKEAREHKEHETQERKEKQARDKREKEARAAKALKEAQEAKEAKEKAKEERSKDDSLLSKSITQSAQPPPPPVAKRAQQPLVPIPTAIPQHPAGFASPKIPAVTPALSKAPTPIRSRALSQQHDQNQPGVASAQPNATTARASPHPQPSTTTSPGPIGQPRRESGSFSSSSQSGPAQTASPHLSQIGRSGMATPIQGLPSRAMQPPPGLHHIPAGLPGRLGHDQMMPPGYHPPGMVPPPGINGHGGRGFPSMPMAPPGFGPPPGDVFPPSANQGFPLPQDMPPLGHPTHARQGSASFEAPGTPTQPIARPAPIGRPGTTPQRRRAKEADSETQHLGSRALLEDDDEDIAEPLSNAGSLRNQPPGPMFPPFGSAPYMDHGFGHAHNLWTPSGNLYSSPGLSNPTWTTPMMPPNNFGLGSPPPPPQSRLHRAISPSDLRAIIVEAYQGLQALDRTSASTEGFIKLHHIKSFAQSQHGDLGVLDQELVDCVEVPGNPSNGGGSFDFRNIRGDVAFKWMPGTPEASALRQSPLSSQLVGSAAQRGP